METVNETVETVVNKSPGRPRNPNKLRTIFLNADNTPRKKGAPKPGSQVKAVDCQRSVKNVEFVYGVTPCSNERMVTMPARTYKAKSVVVVNTPSSPIVAPESNPLDVVAPLVAA